MTTDLLSLIEARQEVCKPIKLHIYLQHIQQLQQLTTATTAYYVCCSGCSGCRCL